jgi:ribonuclease VapC
VIAVDTSAIMAILFAEPEAEVFERRIAAEDVCFSSVSLLEASMVLAGRLHGERAWRRLDEMVQEAPLEIVPHDRHLAEIGRLAFLHFGKGRHPAALNCGDCAAYALARHRGIPLLFKGTDFAKTDIVPALPSAA